MGNWKQSLEGLDVLNIASDMIPTGSLHGDDRKDEEEKNL